MSWLGFLGVGGEETIDPLPVLLARVQDSPHLEERKRTILQIKEIASKSNHREIGDSMDTLIKVLKTDKADVEIIRDTLEILINIMSLKPEPHIIPDKSAELRNVSLFIQDKNISALFDLLEEPDQSICYNTTQLLRILSLNKCNELQQSILKFPMGIARLIELLKASREIVRNDILLLLLELTKSNQEIQKIIAFHGAFDILLGIIYREGGNDGGIITQDCLKLMNNLLRGNISNQNFFRETSCIQQLPPLLKLSGSDNWFLTDDKLENTILTLELVSSLISRNNPNSQSNQTMLFKNDILSLVIPLAVGSMRAVSIRIKALVALGDILNGNKEICSKFSTMNVLVGPANQLVSQPTLHRLITVALHAQNMAERNAAVRVFKCFLQDNEEGQEALASTLTPPPATDDISTASIGAQLIHALLGVEDAPIDPLRSWFASCILSYILKDCDKAKNLALRIPLEIPKSGQPMTTLLSKTMRSLTLISRLQSNQNTILVKIGLLKLLCFWLDSCSTAVEAFLLSPNNLTHLVEFIVAPLQEGEKHIQGLCALVIGLCFTCDGDDHTTKNRTSLSALILQRIGVDQFMDKLDTLRKTDEFVRAEQGKTEMDIQQAYTEIINYYDYDFTLLLKSAYDKIHKQMKAPKPKPTEPKAENQTEKTKKQKEINPEYEALLESHKTYTNQLKDQIASLKQELERKESEKNHNHVERIEVKDPEIEKEVLSLREQVKNLMNKQSPVDQEAFQSLSIAYNDLEKAIQQKDSKIEQLEQQLEKQRSKPNQPSPDLLQQIKQLEEQLKKEKEKVLELEKKYQDLTAEQEELLNTLAVSEVENANLKAKLKAYENS